MFFYKIKKMILDSGPLPLYPHRRLSVIYNEGPKAPQD